ncbi:MAG: ankyrin repeat domain-containing protein [Coxiellaceae bacterium]|nr:ankyrin repeat domain-containing protein [Coxiellaceae bacterium]
MRKKGEDPYPLCELLQHRKSTTKYKLGVQELKRQTDPFNGPTFPPSCSHPLVEILKGNFDKTRRGDISQRQALHLIYNALDSKSKADTVNHIIMLYKDLIIPMIDNGLITANHIVGTEPLLHGPFSAPWAFSNPIEHAKALLARGADVNGKIKRDGITPLMSAVKSSAVVKKRTGLINVLLDARADVTVKATPDSRSIPPVKCNAGKTAIDMAQEKGLHDWVALFERYNRHKTRATAVAPTPPRRGWVLASSRAFASMGREEARRRTTATRPALFTSARRSAPSRSTVNLSTLGRFKKTHRFPSSWTLKRLHRHPLWIAINLQKPAESTEFQTAYQRNIDMAQSYLSGIERDNLILSIGNNNDGMFSYGIDSDEEVLASKLIYHALPRDLQQRLTDKLIDTCVKRSGTFILPFLIKCKLLSANQFRGNFTLLQEATREGCHEAMRILLRHNANPDTLSRDGSNSALTLACKNRDSKAINILVDGDANLNQTAGMDRKVFQCAMSEAKERRRLVRRGRHTDTTFPDPLSCFM